MLDTIGQLELVDGEAATQRLSNRFDLPMIGRGAHTSVDLEVWGDQA
jgi:hypothetical protein